MFQSKVPPQNLPDWETEIGMEGSDQFPTLNLRPVEIQGEKEGIGLNTTLAIEVQEPTPGKYPTHNLIGPLPQLKMRQNIEALGIEIVPKTQDTDMTNLSEE